MAQAITLDKTGYSDFKDTLPEQVGAMISVIQFNHQVEASNTFYEYTGKLASATKTGVEFQPGTVEAPSLFFRFISLGTASIPLTPSTEYYLKFYDFYTYMWAYTGGDTKLRAINVSSPKKGGKTKHKRKNRKSKLKTKRS